MHKFFFAFCFIFMMPSIVVPVSAQDIRRDEAFSKCKSYRQEFSDVACQCYVNQAYDSAVESELKKYRETNARYEKAKEHILTATGKSEDWLHQYCDTLDGYEARIAKVAEETEKHQVKVEKSAYIYGVLGELPSANMEDIRVQNRLRREVCPYRRDAFAIQSLDADNIALPASRVYQHFTKICRKVLHLRGK